MLHEIILEQKAQYSVFAMNIFWINFWGNLYHFIGEEIWFQWFLSLYKNIPCYNTAF